MDNTESTDGKLERLLQAKQAAEEELRELDARITDLEAHRRTLASCLTGGEQSTEYPMPVQSGREGAAKAHDITPVYVLNFGACVSTTPNDPFGAARCPNGYRIIRKFARHRNSRSPHSEIFYTTTALLQKRGWYYVIRDDENNICGGHSAFEEFKEWFDEPLPFRNIEEWLGLYSHEIWSRVAAMHEPSQSRGAGRPSTVLQYFADWK